MSSNGKRYVMVVDDQPQVLKFIEIDLIRRGYDVVTVASGGKALEMVKSEPPDIMLLDIIMPDMDGFQVLKELRSFSRLPVIAFSASAGNIHEAKQLGATDFLTKPFIPDELARRLEILLAHCGNDD